MNKDKIISFLFGDINKWRNLPNAFKSLKKDMKNPKRAAKLIFVFMLCFIVASGLMMSIRWVQNNAQFCDVIKDPRGSTIYQEGAMPVPKSGNSYAWYLEYYEDGRKQTYVYLNCTWDFQRFCEEVLAGAIC
jgi:hypothetical protein